MTSSISRSLVSVIEGLRGSLAVVAHDAGATNLIIAWLKASAHPVRACVQGPARKLWLQAFPNSMIFDTPNETMQGCTHLLSGTGWASSLEHDARIEGRRRGLHVAAVLDHWVNYSSRFERQGKKVWPDEIWVADKWAAKIAGEIFPSIPVRQLENLYLNEQVARVLPPPGDGTLLYTLEPVRNDWGRGLDGEFQALDYLLANRMLLIPGPIRRILLRPHPSDPVGKYDQYISASSHIELDCSADMAEALSLSDLVAGVESFALTIALAAGRSVYSSLPPWAPPLRLPQEGIRQIRLLTLK